MEDCYYFLYSKCSKQNCEFRHSPTAKENPILCTMWKQKKSCKKDCPFRHSTYHLNKKRHEMGCFWEDACTKEFCEFKHSDPRKDEWKMSRVKSLDEIIDRKRQTKEENMIKEERDTKEERQIMEERHNKEENNIGEMNKNKLGEDMVIEEYDYGKDNYINVYIEKDKNRGDFRRRNGERHKVLKNNVDTVIGNFCEIESRNRNDENKRLMERGFEKNVDVKKRKFEGMEKRSELEEFDSKKFDSKKFDNKKFDSKNFDNNFREELKSNKKLYDEDRNLKLYSDKRNVKEHGNNFREESYNNRKFYENKNLKEHGNNFREEISNKNKKIYEDRNRKYNNFTEELDTDIKLFDENRNIKEHDNKNIVEITTNKKHYNKEDNPKQNNITEMPVTQNRAPTVQNIIIKDITNEKDIDRNINDLKRKSLPVKEGSFRDRSKKMNWMEKIDLLEKSFTEEKIKRKSSLYKVPVEYFVDLESRIACDISFTPKKGGFEDKK